MKAFFSFILFGFLLQISFAQKIYSTDWKSDADVKVFVTEWKSDPDLIVYKIT